MAKYIDVSATYNGDGTASNQAAIAGGVGAWNSLVNPLIGSPGYGAVAAGDTVYVRTKNGTNLGESTAASKTASTTPTVVLPIDWVFDNGSVWDGDGDSGVFTLTIGSGFNLALRPFHNFKAVLHNFKIFAAYSGSSTNTFLYLDTARHENICIETIKSVTNCGPNIKCNGNTRLVLDSPLFNIGTFYYSSVSYPFFFTAFGSFIEMNNPWFDLLGTAASGSSIFGASGYGTRIEVYGGGVLNGTETQFVYYINQSSTGTNIFRFFGFNNDLLNTDNAFTGSPGSDWKSPEVTFTGCNGKNFDFKYSDITITYDWSEGQNYPVLSAILPDSANTPWSVRVMPKYTAKGMPGRVNKLGKIYTAVPSVRTLTAELLINDSYGVPTKEEWWMEGFYVQESNGERIFFTTYGTGNIETSTASWSSTVYGSATYNKFKLSFLTPTAIKQHTEIMYVIKSAKAPISILTDFYFLDPELEIT